MRHLITQQNNIHYIHHPKKKMKTEPSRAENEKRIKNRSRDKKNMKNTLRFRFSFPHLWRAAPLLSLSLASHSTTTTVSAESGKCLRILNSLWLLLPLSHSTHFITATQQLFSIGFDLKLMKIKMNMRINSIC